MNPNDLTLENTHSSKPQNISETLLKHGEMLLVQTGSWNWLVCRMRAVEFGGSSHGSELDWNHSIISHQQDGPHRTAAPSQPQTSQSATICSRRNTWHQCEDSQNQNIRNLWELVEFVNGQVLYGARTKKGFETNNQRCRKPTGWRAGDAGGSALTATARTARHARFSELWLRLLARFLYGFNVRENSSMLGWARLYCERRNTIHTILEHSKFSSWHLGFAVDYDHRHHSKFGTKHDRMSWMKNIKHYVRDYS